MPEAAAIERIAPHASAELERLRKRVDRLAIERARAEERAQKWKSEATLRNRSIQKLERQLAMERQRAEQNKQSAGAYRRLLTMARERQAA